MTQKKKTKDAGRPVAALPAGAGTSDHARAAFTKAVVAALRDLDQRKLPSAYDLGQGAYEKLQYDLPLVSADELEGLAQTLRSSLQLKSGQPPFPLTSKLLENLVTGARPLVTTSIPVALAKPESAISPAAGGDTGSNTAVTMQPKSGSTPEAAEPSPSGAPTPDPAAAAVDNPMQSLASTTAETNTLLQPELLQPDRLRLCSAYRSVCAVVFVQLVSHCLAVSEQDTWALLCGLSPGTVEDEQDDGLQGQQGAAEGAGRTHLSPSAAGPAVEGNGCCVAAVDGVHSACQGQQQQGPYDGSETDVVGDVSGANSCGLVAGNGHSASVGLEPISLLPSADGHSPDRARPDLALYGAVEAAEEDGDDFVFDDLEDPGTSTPPVMSTSAPGPPTPSYAAYADPWRSATPHPLPPYTWPALQQRLFHIAGQLSYVLLDDPDLWRDGCMLQGIFQLLRTLGAHRHAQELQPLLHAYVGLVADRIAAAPDELGCLDSLWDAVGIPAIASLPKVSRQRPNCPAAAPGQVLLLAEASTCLSLVASLSGQLTGASARLRLWQQVHRHMLPLLERCLGELARAVGPGPGSNGAKAGASVCCPHQAPKSPGAEEVAAIVLVCQVLDFYVQQRPANVDLLAALKGSGVLAALALLFAAAAPLPGAEPLRSATLCCAASSRELHTWVLAVPGVAQALAGPAFQEGGVFEDHGAVWQLLGNGGSSPMALSILAGGAVPEKAVRVHSLLQLLAKAAACRGNGSKGGAGAVWGPTVECALQELFAALREEQAGCAASAAAAGGGQEGGNGLQGQSAGRHEGGGSDLAFVEEDDDDEKLQLLDPAALVRRRARQLHPACWRLLKQMLATGKDSCSKTD